MTPAASRRVRTALWQGLPAVAALALATAIFHATDWDLRLSSLFADASNIGKFGHAFNEDHPFFKLVYKYGEWPSIACGAAAGCVLALGLVRPGLRRWRREALFTLLLLALGAGTLVNAVMKEGWGRPRPRELAVFGGRRMADYVPPGRFGPGGTSFPGGHAASAFFMVFPYFLLRRSRPRLAAACLLLGLAWWAVVGVVRIGQGGHFASDILWSAGVMWLTAVALAAILDVGSGPGAAGKSEVV